MKTIETSLKVWKVTENYWGINYNGLFLIAGKSRDSQAFELSNFETILKDLRDNFTEGDYDDETGLFEGDFLVARFGHWAVGWIEEIMINPNSKNCVSFCESIQKKLEDYPLYDEDDFSVREDEEYNDTWNQCYTLREKIKVCADNGLSIFQAREKYCPYRDDGERVIQLY